MKKEIEEEEICKNCKWRGQNDYFARDIPENKLFLKKSCKTKIRGQCWRYPKRYNTWDDDFCGEFKLKSQTN